MKIPQALKQHLFNLGDIIFVKNYDYEDGGIPTDKLIVILHKGVSKNDLTYITYSLTTSQLKKRGIHDMFKIPGCVKLEAEAELHFHFYPKGKKVGRSGFAFGEDTVIIFRDNVKQRNVDEFEQFLKAKKGFKPMDMLTDIELYEILTCALNSDHINEESEEKLKESLQIVKARLGMDEIDEDDKAQAAE